MFSIGFLPQPRYTVFASYLVTGTGSSFNGLLSGSSGIIPNTYTITIAGGGSVVIQAPIGIITATGGTHTTTTTTDVWTFTSSGSWIVTAV